MSNWKHAYGWFGHIIVADDAHDADPDHNVVEVPFRTFAKLLKDCENCTLDRRISAQCLGITGDSEPVEFLACGTGFSVGFEFWGTVFTEAEARIGPNGTQDLLETEYMDAMKEIYGISLPPCRPMIGCSSEMP